MLEHVYNRNGKWWLERTGELFSIFAFVAFIIGLWVELP